MFVSTRSTRVRRALRRSAVAGAATAMALVGAAGATGVASAAPTPNYGAVQYSPTITATPGFGCFAIITATKLPQTVAGQYQVKVKINQFGVNCGSYQIGISYRNTTSGSSDGLILYANPDGTIDGTAPGNIFTGFGMAPDAGKIVSTIDTYKQYDEAGVVKLPHVAGTASFTLY